MKNATVCKAVSTKEENGRGFETPTLLNLSSFSLHNSLPAQAPLPNAPPSAPLPMSTMLLKPVPINFQSSYAHRRAPSAPVVVQPTHTPGILSIKPAHTPRQPPSTQRHGARPVARQAKPAQVVRAQLPSPAAHSTDKAPATPSPQPRGRAQAKYAKEKTSATRSASSHSPIRGKHGRQPSPQVPVQQTPSQAEAIVISTVKSTTLFDPFVDSSIPNAYLNSPPPSPTLARPSGKLARRREHQHNLANADPTSTQSPSPMRSKAIPVPSANGKRSKPTLSRSDPVPSHMAQRPRPTPQRSMTFLDFPICDDAADDGLFSPPSTPVRTTPRTAAGFTFPTPPAFTLATAATAVRKSPRKHRRVPSDGVFNMSSDEDLSTASSGSGSGSSLNANVQALFGLPRTPVAAKRMSTPAHYAYTGSTETREQQLEREANEKAGYFASSMFQNSPSPEELPDPLLL